MEEEEVATASTSTGTIHDNSNRIPKNTEDQNGEPGGMCTCARKLICWFDSASVFLFIVFHCFLYLNHANLTN